MNARCEEMLDRIALAAGDDLPTDERAELERHLADCAECRAFAEDLGAALEDLRRHAASTFDLETLEEEDLTVEDLAVEEDLAEIRAAVLRSLAEDRSRRILPFPARRVLFGFASAAAAAGILLTAWLGRPLPEPTIESPPPIRPASFQRAAFRPRAWERPATEASTVIKLVSEDPDVVIYWLVDETAPKTETLNDKESKHVSKSHL